MSLIRIYQFRGFAPDLVLESYALLVYSLNYANEQWTLHYNRNENCSVQRDMSLIRIYQFWGFAPDLVLESYVLLVYLLNLMSMNSGHCIAIEMIFFSVQRDMSLIRIYQFRGFAPDLVLERHTS